MPADLPVVIVPGIMGSRLYFPNADRYWDPDRPRRMAWWAPVWPVRSDEDNRQDLYWEQPAGVVFDSKDVSPAERDRGWSTVVWSFYGDMLRRLQAGAGESPVFAVGYDWRQDIGGLAWYVSGKIRECAALAGATKMAVVTHSMGGLVIRAALRIDPGLKDIVGPVVHICQPSAGAVILYRRLFTGLVRNSPDGWGDGGGGLFDRIFRLLLGNTRPAFLGNMSGMPGAMQLLPSEHFPIDGDGQRWHADLANGVPHSRLYSDEASPPGLAPVDGGLATEVLSRLRERAAEVAATHELLGPPPPQSPDTYLIYGTGRPTEVRIGFDGGLRPTVAPLGDEVVPEVSARALGLPQERVIGVVDLKHADACADATVQNIVSNILAGGSARLPMFSLPSPTLSETRTSPPTGEDGVEAWLRAAPAVAAHLGARVRVTVEYEPPSNDGT